MEKKVRIVLIFFLIIVTIKGFDDAYLYQTSQYNDSPSPILTEHAWQRDGGGDTETIYFSEDGKFGYYCACGNPVDYYDLCDSYKYDANTSTIKLKCLPGVKVNKLKILEVSKTKLVLDFDGEKREFITEYEHLIDNPLPFAGEKFRTPGSDEEIVIEFNKYGNFEAYNKTKGGYALDSDVCFTWEYNKENNEITLDCQDHTKKIKITKYPQSQGEEIPQELELYFEDEDKSYYFVKVKDNQ